MKRLITLAIFSILRSLLAVLDSFVYDPLLTWRLLNTASNNPKKEKLEM